MALNDILDSIVADADRRIDDASAAHKKNMKEMRDASGDRALRTRMQISENREQQKQQIKERAESGARMLNNRKVLAAKQSHIDEVYSQVLEKLVGLPKEDTEAFLKKCLSHVHGKGVIRAAKEHESIVKKHLPDGCEMGEMLDVAGGFRFESDREEHDFTYEFIVHGLLRPMTEANTAAKLFPRGA